MVIHIMKDGTTRKSIDGANVPINPSTEKAYQIINKYKGENKR